MKKNKLLGYLGCRIAILSSAITVIISGCVMSPKNIDSHFEKSTAVAGVDTMAIEDFTKFLERFFLDRNLRESRICDTVKGTLPDDWRAAETATQRLEEKLTKSGMADEMIYWRCINLYNSLINLPQNRDSIAKYLNSYAETPHEFETEITSGYDSIYRYLKSFHKIKCLQFRTPAKDRFGAITFKNLNGQWMIVDFWMQDYFNSDTTISQTEKI